MNPASAASRSSSWPGRSSRAPEWPSSQTPGDALIALLGYSGAQHCALGTDGAALLLAVGGHSRIDCGFHRTPLWARSSSARTSALGSSANPRRGLPPLGPGAGSGVLAGHLPGEPDRGGYRRHQLRRAEVGRDGCAFLCGEDPLSTIGGANAQMPQVSSGRCLDGSGLKSILLLSWSLACRSCCWLPGCLSPEQHPRWPW
jgi:hypothetical protein